MHKTIFYVGIVLGVSGYRLQPVQYHYQTREIGTNLKHIYVTDEVCLPGDTIRIEFIKPVETTNTSLTNNH